MAQIGEVIEGKYEILKQIGKGGMSKVYLAMDLRLNKQWAIKEIMRQGMDSERNNEIVVNSAIVEANMIKTLDHYNIPHVNDILEYDDFIYVVMDYVEGESLLKIIKTEGPQPQARVIKWGKQLCDALHYLHTRIPPIVYRDMKPANVMVKPDGDVKLIDFGIAREYKEVNIADTTVLGTVGYAPPEQFGGGQTDARADIYALGATLYHAVTGRGPVKGEAFIIEPIRKWNPQLSGGLEKIISKCTMPKPKDRYQSCVELMYDLEHYREVDDAFLIKQKRKLTRFIVVLCISVFFLLTGVFGQFMRVSSINKNYEQNNIWAQTKSYDAQAARELAAEGKGIAAINSELQDKVYFYTRMTDIKPLEREPYSGMVSTFKADSVFDTVEEKRFYDVITKNRSGLRNESFYSDLAFEVGQLYWIYYDYGRAEGSASDANKNTRMGSAVTWFADVSEGPNVEIAKIYHDIAVFNKDIASNTLEASDSGKYLPYWGNLSSLADIVLSDENDSEIVPLTVSAALLEAVTTYASKFKSDGVPEQDIRTALGNVENSINGISPTGETTERIKTEALIQLGLAETAVANAYRVDDRGLQYGEG
ncbi:MAG: serine/threonine protein kinase [Clostridiales Family XIII bacterium]|nr:serine/threonine protein kinase [Clostridiales Family XIII bacterium]